MSTPLWWRGYNTQTTAVIMVIGTTVETISLVCNGSTFTGSATSANHLITKIEVTGLTANTEYPFRPPKELSLHELRIRNFTRNVEVGWPIYGKKFECLIGSIIYNREGLTELTEKTDFHD